jgi:hypothetical protein
MKQIILLLLFSLPLQAKLIPVSQYACITRVGAVNPQNGTYYYDSDAKIHFYFNGHNRPNLNEHTSKNLFCHDILTFGLSKGPSDPLLDEISDVFFLWDEKRENTIPLKWYMGFHLPGPIPTLGYMEKPFKGRCSKDSQGLFIALRGKIILTEEDGYETQAPDSVLLIQEELLRKIAFVKIGNRHERAHINDFEENSLYFYYPPNLTHPLKKTPDQKEFKLISKDEWETGEEVTSSSLKFGCIPRVNLEQKPVGLGRTGQRCRSDFSCAGLCCKHGRCASHNPSMGAYCAKSVGQSCVSRSYCGKQTVESCYIVKTGNKTCALRCYKNRIFPHCKNGRCTQLRNPPIPSFDPKNPDCSEAIDPPY